jgi:hypothetical protein
MLFATERDIAGLPTEERRDQRQQWSATHLAGLEAWMRTARAKRSRHAGVAKAMDYKLTRWEIRAFTPGSDEAWSFGVASRTAGSHDLPAHSAHQLCAA